jgi:D-alanine transfer protein
MKRIHLLPALWAIILVATALSGGVLYAGIIESQFVRTMAPQFLRVNNTGNALQRIALQQPDWLLVYGSSEIVNEVLGYTAPEVFHGFPTGFAPFEVAQGGENSLVIAQEVASLGPDLRGKKIVISFTPDIFFEPMLYSGTYEGLFLPLRANELAFSTQLSYATKQEAARRMLQYPKTLEKEPLLRFALERLAGDSLLDRALYYAVWPLGKLWTLVLELQDQWQTLTFLWAPPKLQPPAPHVPAPIDWQALEAKAEREQEANANNNPFGFDNTIWIAHYQNPKPGDDLFGPDKAAVTNLKQTLEWTDLDILLRTLKDMGAQPLIMSRPFSATYWDTRGVTAQDRQAFYDRLSQVVASYDMPLVDFRDHETDKYFNTDAASHTSRKGWVYVDKALDEFYHGTLRQPSDANRDLDVLLPGDSAGTDLNVRPGQLLRP